MTIGKVFNPLTCKPYGGYNKEQNRNPMHDENNIIIYLL